MNEREKEFARVHAKKNGQVNNQNMQAQAAKSEEELEEEAVEALSSAINVRDSNVDEC